MERLHWVRHCCRQLLAAGTGRGCYSAPDVMVAKRRSVFARHGPRQHEHRSTCRGLNTNAIRTTKYSLLTFVPLNLFQQFHRAANLYFLFLALLNWVPVVEAFQKEITMVPLLVVLTVIAIKDVMEDYRRYVFDKKVNNKVVQVFCGKDKRYVEQCWKDVQVGDFVRLTCNEVIPADMLLLDSSDPRRLCYVETANLDGESNLKQRQVVCELPLHGGGVTPENFHGRIECEKPNDDLSRFRGFIENTSGTRIGLHTNNLLLRSCIIRNTEAVVGVVVYAGHDTKAMMNNSGPRSKRSRLERQLNTHVLWCVLLLVLLCLTAAVGHGFWLKELKDSPFLLDAGTSPALAAFYVFWTMIIVLQVLIPISLYVSIEIVKLGQVYFIQNDMDLYNQRLDSRIQCRTLNITEDLGQIQYLFSDKTGTLTENQMVFRRCSIFGVEYPHLENMRRSEVKELDRTGAAACPPTLTSVCSRPSLSCGSASCGSCSAAEDGVQPRTQAFSSHVTKEVVADPELVRKLSRLSSPVLSTAAVSSEASLELTYITDFFLALTICNSVVVSPPPQLRHQVPQVQTSFKSLEEIKLMFQRFRLSPFLPRRETTAVQEAGGVEVRDTEAGTRQDIEDEPLYEAESPDEAALVHAARAYGCTLRGRSADSVLLDFPGTGPLTVQVLHILPFDPNRKRMSVVVRHPFTGKVVVYTKGADSVIMELAEKAQGTEQRPDIRCHIRAQTQKHLDTYARDGLRTLCIAQKVLEEDEYKVWLKRQLLAESSIENREELLLDSAQRLEINLTLLGTTGVEDRLQEDVPETVECLQRAGIQMWVLTGDKQETAVNIAYACRLIRPEDRLLSAGCQSRDSCAVLLEQLRREVEGGDIADAAATENHQEASTGRLVLVVDGQTLDWVLQEDTSRCFLELSRRCRSVICCRSTPLQKSQVVRLIRDQLHVTTLAVGDGANDVSMIQVADVGVGISGQEGLQAAMSSDFAISRFKHLRKLLLVHGNWCHSRLSNMILYFIYKNVMYVNLLFWYQFFCGFSGSVMTNAWVLIFFNLFFTSVPPLVYGVLDKHTRAETLMQLPELYQAAHIPKTCVSLDFWITVLDAFYQSLVCFFVPYFTYSGSDVGQMSFGSPINASALLIVLLHQVIEGHTLTWIHAVVLLLSGGSYFLFVLLFSGTCSAASSPVGVETLQMSHPLFYIVCVLTTVTALLPRFLFRVLQNTVLRSSSKESAPTHNVDSEKSSIRTQQNLIVPVQDVDSHHSKLVVS